MAKDSTPITPLGAAQDAGQDAGPGTGRYAAYDLTLARFVEGIYTSKAEAAEAAEAKDEALTGDRVEVREV